MVRSGGDALTLMVFDLFRAHGALLRFGDDFVAEHDLASSSWQVLGAVSRGGGEITVPGIARRMGQARQSVQRQVNGLLDRGLIELRENPNHRRSPHLALTTSGQRLHDTIQKRWATWARAVSKSIPAQDLQAVRRTLEAFTEALER